MNLTKNGSLKIRPIDLDILNSPPFRGNELPKLLAARGTRTELAPITSAATLVCLRHKPETRANFWAHYRQLLDCSNSPEQHYKTIVIRSKTGKKRVLHQADVVLDGYQVWLKKNILDRIVLPGCAMAYRKGCSIRDNAEVHLGQNEVVKMDIKCFFNSITAGMVHRTIERLTGYSKEVLTLLTAVCCYEGKLPQGAATSPVLSNLVMLDFDQWAMDFAAEMRLKYTRYSDDLTFSGEKIDVGVLIRETSIRLAKMSFTLNRKKTRLLGKGACHNVTGILCNETLNVPKDYRRKLRQEMHYLVKHGSSHIVRMQCQRPFLEGEEGYIRSLMGRVGYVLSVAPENVEFNEYYEFLNELMLKMYIAY